MTKLGPWRWPIVATIGFGLVVCALVISPQMTLLSRMLESAFLALIVGIAWLRTWRHQRRP